MFPLRNLMSIAALALGLCFSPVALAQSDDAPASRQVDFAGGDPS